MVDRLTCWDQLPFQSFQLSSLMGMFAKREDYVLFGYLFPRKREIMHSCSSQGIKILLLRKLDSFFNPSFAWKNGVVWNGWRIGCTENANNFPLYLIIFSLCYRVILLSADFRFDRRVESRISTPLHKKSKSALSRKTNLFFIPFFQETYVAQTHPQLPEGCLQHFPLGWQGVQIYYEKAKNNHPICNLVSIYPPSATICNLVKRKVGLPTWAAELGFVFHNY